MANRPKPVSSDAQSALHAEQLQSLCKGQLSSMPISSFLAILIVLTMRHDVDRDVLSGWLVAILIANGTRLVFAIRHRSKPIPRSTSRFLVFQSLMSLVSGLIWAAVPAQMFVMDNLKSYYVLYIIFGLIAGSSAQSWGYSLSAISGIPSFLTTRFASIFEGL